MKLFILGALVLGLLSATGCGASAVGSPKPGAVIDTSSDAVAVDFYVNDVRGATCAGTLLSESVVMTAAHCAMHANAIRVKAPNVTTTNANGAQAEVARVMFYDWGLTPSHAQEHDVALLVLRTKIAAPAFAQVDDSTALRAIVNVGGRYVDDGGHAATEVSKNVSVADAAPQGRSFALDLKAPASGATAGGAVKRPNGALVGVYMGAGKTTGTGYFTRIDDGEIVGWMRGIVSAKGGKLTFAPNAGSSLTSSSLSGAALRNLGGGSQAGSAAPPGDPTEDVDDDATPDDSDQSDAAPEKTDHGDGTLSGDSATANVSQGDNYWAAFEPNDPAGANDVDAAYAEAHPDAAEVGAHGSPGYMANRPDADTLQSMADGKDAMIVASCYAGAPQADGGPSNAASLADDANMDPSQVYGCTGTMSLSASSANCNGSWVDGNGDPVSDDQMAKYGLIGAPPADDCRGLEIICD